MRALRWTSVLAVVTSTTLAHAQHDPAGAEALFREGKAALEAGQTDRACALFRQSHDLDAAPGTLFHLGDCEEKRGRIATAWALFEEVASKLARSDERLAAVQARGAALAPTVPRLAIRLQAQAPRQSQVSRDGVALRGEALGAAMPVDPGAHVVVVTAPGRAERRFEISVGRGERRTLDVAPGDIVAPAASGSSAREPERPAPIHDASGSTQRTMGIVAGGVGLGAMGAAIAVGLIAKSDYDESESHCVGDRCDATGLAVRRDARVLGDVATVVFVSGVALAGAGAVLWLTAPSPRRAAVGLGPGRVTWRTSW